MAMKFEIPEFKRCCFCVPLRYGLLVWSYLFLVLMAADLKFKISNLTMEIQYFDSDHNDWYNMITSIIFLLMSVGCLAFTMLMIVAAHKKSSRLLRTYYVFAFWLTMIQIIFKVSNIIRVVVLFWPYLYWRLVCLFSAFYFSFYGVQLYIIALVKSEILKLENNIGYRFVNHAAAAESAVNERRDEHTTQTNNPAEEGLNEDKDLRVY